MYQIVQKRYLRATEQNSLVITECYVGTASPSYRTSFHRLHENLHALDIKTQMRPEVDTSFLKAPKCEIAKATECGFLGKRHHCPITENNQRLFWFYILVIPAQMLNYHRNPFKLNLFLKVQGSDFQAHPKSDF